MYAEEDEVMDDPGIPEEQKSILDRVRNLSGESSEFADTFQTTRLSFGNMVSPSSISLIEVKK